MKISKDGYFIDTEELKDIIVNEFYYNLKFHVLHNKLFIKCSHSGNNLFNFNYSIDDREIKIEDNKIYLQIYEDEVIDLFKIALDNNKLIDQDLVEFFNKYVGNILCLFNIMDSSICKIRIYRDGNLLSILNNLLYNNCHKAFIGISPYIGTLPEADITYDCEVYVKDFPKILKAEFRTVENKIYFNSFSLTETNNKEVNYIERTNEDDILKQDKDEFRKQAKNVNEFKNFGGLI